MNFFESSNLTKKCLEPKESVWVFPFAQKAYEEENHQSLIYKKVVYRLLIVVERVAHLAQHERPNTPQYTTREFDSLEGFFFLLKKELFFHNANFGNIHTKVTKFVNNKLILVTKKTNLVTKKTNLVT